MHNESKTIEVELLKDGFPNITKFYLGARGSGKTTLMANELKASERFVIFDAKNDYAPDFFGGDVAVVSTIEHFVDALNRGNMRIIVRVPVTDEQADLFLSECCNYLMMFQSANPSSDIPPVVVSIDEMNRFAATSSCPDGLKQIITTGRDHRIILMFGAQWFGTLPPIMRDAFTEIYVWKHTDKNGLNLLENFGFNRDEIKNLPPYSCLHTGKNGVELIRLAASSSTLKTKTPEANLTH